MRTILVMALLACTPQRAPEAVVIEPLPPSPSSSAFTEQRTLQPPPPAPRSIVTASGLEIEDLRPGTGAEATSGHTAVVHYVGQLVDGTEFDSSRRRGTPFTFHLGAGQVIKGWDEGVVGMRVGGLRRLTIPPQLAYGSSGAGGTIGPNATLVFEVELLDVK